MRLRDVIGVDNVMWGSDYPHTARRRFPNHGAPRVMSTPNFSHRTPYLDCDRSPLGCVPYELEAYRLYALARDDL
jgi:hypothetical protein